MKILDPGHRYALKTLDANEFHIVNPHILQFVKRMGPNYPGNTSCYPGTVMQEVIRALLNRLQYVENQQPCVENGEVSYALRQALYWLEIRNARIKGLDMIFDLYDIPRMATCDHCLHIMCHEFHHTE